MRKLFLLLPALVLSLIANATVQTISPSSEESDSNIRSALSGTADTIILNAGNYKEADQIHFRRNAVIMAAEGADVTITPKYYCDFTLSAKVKIIGIKFDGSVSNQQAIRVYDASAGKELRLENCEFYNFAKDVISGDKAECTTDSCIVNNCYFHNNNYSAIYFNESSVEGKQTIYGLKVTNSTFANNDPSKEYRALIDVQSYNRSATDDIEVIVDHCTFYNNTVMNYDYSAIRTRIVNRTTVSNCIFAHPSAQDWYATNVWAGSVTNCLAYNFNNGYNAPTKTEANTGNPLFTDDANGDFSLAGNWVTMNLSPARGAATDGSDLGDPRWYIAETLPSTDFASPYAFVGAKAQITGNIWYDSENGYLYGDGGSNKDYGTATWKFHAEKACIVGVAVNLNSGNTSGHKLRVEVLDADGNKVDEFAEQASTLPGTLTIPAVGDYKIILHDDQTWSSAKIDNVTLSYIGGDVQDMPGTTNIADAWFSANGTRADGKISFPGSTIQDGWVKWNVSFANTGNYNVTLNINSNNCKNYTVALVDANDANVVTPLTLNDCSTTGTPVALAMGAMEVPAGNYILKVTNATQNSDAELISVNFAYTGGGIIDIPGTIALNEAILSERAFIDGDGLHFVDAEHLWLMSEGYAKWNIHVAADGIYKFTANCNSSNYSNLTIQVLQGGEEKYTYTPEYSYSGEKTIVSPEWFLEAGNYELKLSNPANNSNGYLVSLIATAEENVFVIDENTTDDGSIAAAADAGISYKFLLKRSFTAGRYYTICIPVGSWNDELKLAFGADYELWKMSSATQSGDEISLNFEQCNTEYFHAGWPYLIKPSIDVQNPVFHNLKTIQNSTYNNVQSFAAADFIGSFYKTVIPAGESNLYLQNNNLYYSETNNTPIKGTRAWIRLKQSGSLAPARARIVLLNQVVTNIQLAEPEENKAIKTIENGQLIIIRDGVRYNAMGVVMK